MAYQPALYIPYVPPLEDDERYLESDGKPMAETERHRHLMVDTLHTLESHFAEVPEVCISGDIMMYYIEGDYWKSVAPDVFVTFGVERKERRTYKIWEEGKPPDFVLEFSSKRTVANDLGLKKNLYAEVIGVTEYFLYDAERIYLPGGPLIGFRLIGRSYVRIPPGIGGGIPARTLGVELKLRGDSMGFYDAVLGEWLKTPAEKAAAALQEEAAARQVAEAAFRDEAAARQVAESRARQAEQELEQLRAALRTEKNS